MDYLDPGMSSRNADGKAPIDGKQIGKGTPNTFVQSKIDGELEDHVKNGKSVGFEPWKPAKKRRGGKRRKKKSALSIAGASSMPRRRRSLRKRRARAPTIRKARRRRRRRRHRH